jgi:hypothetical protein
MKEGREPFKILTGIPNGKCPIGRLKRKWEVNIKMELKEFKVSIRGTECDIGEDERQSDGRCGYLVWIMHDKWRYMKCEILNEQLLGQSS